MTCSRCGTAIQSPEQFERGLCAGCITGSSLSALVALAAQAAQVELDSPPFQPDSSKSLADRGFWRINRPETM